MNFNEQAQTKKHPLHRAATSAANILVPPIAGRWHGRYRNRGWHLFLDTVLALMLLFFAGLNIFFLTKTVPGVPAEPSVSITGPDHVASGDPVAITISVGRVTGTLNHTTFTLAAPKGFVYERSDREPTDATHPNSWLLGTLDHAYSFTIEGRLVGDPETPAVFTGRLQTELNGQRHTLATSWQTTLTSPTLHAVLTVPSPVTSGQPFTLTVGVTNSGTTELQSLSVTLTMPVGYQSAAGETPVQHPVDVTKTIDTLAAGEQTPVRFPAILVLPEEQTVLFSGTVGIRIGETKLIVTTVETSTRVLAAPSGAEISFGENTDTIQFAAEAHYYGTSGLQFGYGPLPPQIGQTTGYRVFWTVRSGKNALTHATVSAALPPDVVWASHASVTHGNGITYDESKRTVTWDLGSIAASDGSATGSFELTLTPTKSDLGKILPLLLVSTISARTDTTSLTQTASALTTDLSGPLERGKGTVHE